MTTDLEVVVDVLHGVCHRQPVPGAGAGAELGDVPRPVSPADRRVHPVHDHLSVGVDGRAPVEGDGAADGGHRPALGGHRRLAAVGGEHPRIVGGARS